MASKHPIEVAAAVIEKDGKFLIAQRYANSHLGGLWEFPGGKRESQESFEDCLKRELFEELAIEIEVDKFWKTVLYSYPEKTVELHFYFCSLKNGNPKPDGCQDYRWVQPSELGHFNFPPADLEIIQELSSNKSWQRRS